MSDLHLRKVTASHVAKAAGVSLATVDRVLNNRAGVRHETRERVMTAARQLDFKRNVHAANLAKQRRYRLLFILPSRASGFAQNLERAVRGAPAAFAHDDINVVVQHVDMSDAAALAKEIEAIDPDAWDGVAVKASDAPGIREAIDEKVEAGLPVVTLVTDASNSKRQHFVGIDNIAAGRVAGSLMGRFLPRKPAKVGIIIGSLQMRDHVERRIGFEQVVMAEHPHLSVLPVAESDDVREVTERITRDMLEANTSLAGIYSASAGNVGILRALEKIDPARRPVLIVHELAPPVRKALIQGQIDAVINQNPEHEARSAVRVLKALSDGHPIVESQEKIRTDIFLRDNLP